MSDQLVQISKREGTIDRVKVGETPTIEIHLAPGQYVDGVELKQVFVVYSDRKTVDWKWTLYVVTPLGEPS